MSNIEMAMHYLDMIEKELDKIAISIGHPTMEEFFQ